MLQSMLGRKIGMTSVYNAEGDRVQVTVIEAGPCYVTQVKTVKTDGVNAVQHGFGKARPKNTSKPAQGIFKKAKVDPLKILRQFSTQEEPKFNLGDVIKVDIFEGTNKVDVIGTTKGKGFQGVIRRYNKASGPKSHGSMNMRTTGSVGASAFPSRVRPNMHMPGHMGNERYTSKNLEIVKIDPQNNLLLVKGAVAGYEDNFVIITKSGNQVFKGRGPKPVEKDKKQPTAKPKRK